MQGIVEKHPIGEGPRFIPWVGLILIGIRDQRPRAGVVHHDGLPERADFVSSASASSVARTVASAPESTRTASEG